MPCTEKIICEFIVIRADSTTNIFCFGARCQDFLNLVNRMYYANKNIYIAGYPAITKSCKIPQLQKVRQTAIDKATKNICGVESQGD